MGRNVLTCLNLDAEGWMGWQHLRCLWPQTSYPNKGASNIIVYNFPKEKRYLTPRRKITRVFLRKTKIYLLTQKIAILITACQQKTKSHSLLGDVQYSSQRLEELRFEIMFLECRQFLSVCHLQDLPDVKVALDPHRGSDLTNIAC